MTRNMSDVRKKLDDTPRKEMNIDEIQISGAWGFPSYIRIGGNHVPMNAFPYFRDAYRIDMSYIHRIIAPEFYQSEQSRLKIKEISVEFD